MWSCYSDFFWRRKKFDVGGGKCEVDAPQSNKCEFNHSGHINSELSSILKRKKYKNANHKIFGIFREAFETFLSLFSDFIHGSCTIPAIKFCLRSYLVVSQKPAGNFFKKAKKRQWILYIVQYSS